MNNRIYKNHHNRNNQYVKVRDLGALGLYDNDGNPILLLQNSQRNNWYRLRAGKKRADVSSEDVEIFRDGDDSERIRNLFETRYRGKMH